MVGTGLNNGIDTKLYGVVGENMVGAQQVKLWCCVMGNDDFFLNDLP